jgi:MSHA biogenesis protein MshN
VAGKNDSAGKRAEAIVAAPVKQISPQQQAEFSYQKAVALLQQGRVSEAQESLGESLRAAPDHAASRQALAGILVEKKQYAQAEQLLREGLARGGSQPEFAMAMARIQVERGDGRGALETLQQNLPGAKDHAGYQAFLAALLQRQNQHKPAIEHYLTALRLAPASASSLVGLGISLQAENHPAEAQEAFSRARTSGGLSPELQNFVEQRLKQLQQQPR